MSDYFTTASSRFLYPPGKYLVPAMPTGNWTIGLTRYGDPFFLAWHWIILSNCPVSLANCFAHFL